MNQLRYIILFFVGTVFACREDNALLNLTGNVHGKILSKSTGLPLADAEITTTPASEKVFSAADGSFEIPDLVAGNYSLKVKLDDYLTVTEPFNLEGRDSSFLTVKMSRDSLQNTLPLAPDYVFPANFAQNQLRNAVKFRWKKAVDPDFSDPTKYGVLLFKSGATVADTVAWDITDTTATALNLDYSTDYLWQVVVFDKNETAVFGQVWQFRTENFPDNRILFCRKVNDVFQIFSSNEAGTTTVQLTSGSSNHWRPRMNPQRTKIAFLTDEGIDNQIVTMNLDGTGQSFLTILPVSGYKKTDLDFCWSPDGSRLLYMNQNRLYRINNDGSGLFALIEAPVGFTFSECDWTGGFLPKIVARTTGNFIFNSEILLYNEIGALQSKIVADSAGSIGGAMFSIDGTKILFTRDVDGFDAIDGRQINSQMFVKNVATGIVTNKPSFIKAAGFNDLDARFTPNNAKVIFTTTNNDGISSKSIWTANLDGTTRTKLFDDAEMVDWR
jgi:TolB protein